MKCLKLVCSVILMMPLLGLNGCDNSVKEDSVKNDVTTSQPALKMQTEPKGVGRVGDRVFTEKDIDLEFEQMPQNYQKMKNNAAMRANILNNLMTRYALAQKAQKDGFADRPEIKSKLERMQQNMLIQSMNQEIRKDLAPTDQDIADYYQAHQSEYTEPEKAHVRQILIRSGKDAEVRAKRILAKLKKGSDFAKMAQGYSEDESSKENGGDLPPFPRGRMVAEFDQAAFSLKETGDISDLIQTRFGYHILQLIDRQEETRKPLTAVQNQIRKTIEQQRFREWVDQIKQEMNLKIISDAYKTAGQQPVTTQTQRP